MADLSSIDAFFDQVVKGLPYQQLVKTEQGGAGPLLSPMASPAQAIPVQRENVTAIEAKGVEPIEYPEGYKPKVPQSEIIRSNTNAALEKRLTDSSDAAANMGDAANEFGSYKGQMQDALRNLQSSGSKQYTPNADIESRLKKTQGDYEKIEDVPERDIWSELILSFGPAALGAVTGEAGMAAQLPAGKSARDMIEGRRKEAMERVKTARASAEKRYNDLLKLKSQDREAFDKAQQREMDKLKGVLSGTGDLAKMNMDQMNRWADKVDAINKETSSAIQKGATDIAKMEMEPEKEAAKNKRANIIASGQGLREATTLRKEFNSDPVVKNFKDVQQSYTKIKGLVDSPSAAGDLSLIFNYMKMLDPGSTVREGEFATAEKAAGVPEQIRNQYNKIMKGERLTPSQRKDFLNQARSIYDSQQALVGKLEKDYQGLASSYGTSKNLVIPRASEPIGPSETAGAYKDGDTKVLQGKTFIRKGGRWVPK